MIDSKDGLESALEAQHSSNKVLRLGCMSSGSLGLSALSHTASTKVL